MERPVSRYNGAFTPEEVLLWMILSNFTFSLSSISFSSNKNNDNEYKLFISIQFTYNNYYDQ